MEVKQWRANDTGCTPWPGCRLARVCELEDWGLEEVESFSWLGRCLAWVGALEKKKEASMEVEGENSLEKMGSRSRRRAVARKGVFASPCDICLPWIGTQEMRESAKEEGRRSWVVAGWSLGMRNRRRRDVGGNVCLMLRWVGRLEVGRQAAQTNKFSNSP